MRTPPPLRALKILRADKHLLRELGSFVAVNRFETGASEDQDRALTGR
jgi:hypothetical protein